MKKKLFLLLITSFLLAGCSSVNQESTIRKTKETTTTIEATSSKEETTTSYQKGTINNPYTVAEALDIIGRTTTISDTMIYVTGIVSEKPYFNSSRNSYSSYIIDSNGSNTIQIYSGTIDSSSKTKSISEGDIVVAGGYYMFYAKNNQPELCGDDTHTYPIYYSIQKGESVPVSYETKEDNGKETISTEIEFSEENLVNEFDEDTLTWTKGIASVTFDEGTQYSFEVRTNPYRFYVGTYLHIKVSSGSIKYVIFETDNNYPMNTNMPVTSGEMSVETNKKTYIFAQKGTRYIKIHNSNKGEVKNVLVKQARIYKMTIVSYK